MSLLGVNKDKFYQDQKKTAKMEHHNYTIIYIGTKEKQKHGIYKSEKKKIDNG